jgi:hypothetical protein
MLNLLDGGELDRRVPIVNPDRPTTTWRAPRDDPSYDVREPTEEWRQARAAFQFAYPGCPRLLWRRDRMWAEPDNRKLTPGPDLRYEDEASHPLQTRRRPGARTPSPPPPGAGRPAPPSPPARGTVETLLADDARRLSSSRATEESGGGGLQRLDKDQTAEVPTRLFSRSVTGRKPVTRRKTIVPARASAVLPARHRDANDGSARQGSARTRARHGPARARAGAHPDGNTWEEMSTTEGLDGRLAFHQAAGATARCCTCPSRCPPASA